MAGQISEIAAAWVILPRSATYATFSLIEHSLHPQILDENGPLRTEKKADWLDGEDHA